MIKADYKARIKKQRSSRPVNPLLPHDVKPTDIDSIYGDDEGRGSCHICHK